MDKLSLSLLLFSCILSTVLADDPEYKNFTLPPGFKLGVATAAYQVEGGWNADGKGPNIWDAGLHAHPEYTPDKNNGDVACDSYHNYKRDVQMLKELGVNFYRFSISWTRVLPTGRISQINEAGIQFYNNLINELIQNGIEPYVTMYHWDLPQAFQEEFGGWTDRRMVDYFVDYARVLFTRFGDRVKMWMTFNEILQICEKGYGTGEFAPFIRSPGVADYQCAHMVLLAHGFTYRMYEKEFKTKQQGKIGMAIDTDWHEPANSSSPEDVAASDTYLHMNFGWYVNPVFLGDYPTVMIDRIRNISLNVQRMNSSRLPSFTKEEVAVLKGAYDFMGLNHYRTDRCKWSTQPPSRTPSHEDDIGVSCVGVHGPSGVPWGLSRLLVWIKKHYNNPPIYITENGSAGESLIDPNRIGYFRGYLYEVVRAVYEEGCNVLGYTYWSLMDNFEWRGGFTIPMGMYRVDFKSPNKTRTAKQSSLAYNHVIKHRYIDWQYKPNLTSSEE